SPTPHHRPSRLSAIRLPGTYHAGQTAGEFRLTCSPTKYLLGDGAANCASAASRNCDLAGTSAAYLRAGGDEYRNNDRRSQAAQYGWSPADQAIEESSANAAAHGCKWPLSSAARKAARG